MKESDNKKPRQIRLGNKKVDRQMSSLVNRLGKMPGMFNTTTIQKKNIVLIYNPRNHSRWQQKQKPNKITRRARKGADTVRKMADPSGTAMTEVLKHHLATEVDRQISSLVNRSLHLFRPFPPTPADSLRLPPIPSDSTNLHRQMSSLVNRLGENANLPRNKIRQMSSRVNRQESIKGFGRPFGARLSQI